MEDAQTTLRDDYAAALETVEEAPAPVEAPPPASGEPPETPAAGAAETPPGRTAGRPRDEQGRLLPGKPVREAAPAHVASTAPVLGGAATAPAAARPSSWKKEMWPVWDKLTTGAPLTPEEAKSLAAYTGERESDYAKGVSTYKTEADRSKAVWDTIAPFQPLLQQHGIDPIKHIGVMFAAHQALATADPQTKLQHFAKLAQDYGVPLAQLVPQQDGSAQPQVNPQIQWLTQQYQTLAGQLNNWQTHQEKQSQQEIDANLNTFKGAAGHEHFETVRQTMAGLLQSGLAEDLEGAYRAAVRMPQHSDIFDAIQKQESIAAETERKRIAAETVARAKSNAVSVRSNSPTGNLTQGGDKGLREHYSELLDSAGGRV